MKKRLLSFLTCLALCLSLLPATALATDDPAPNIYVGGVGLYGDADTIAYAKTSTDGAVTTEGASADDYHIMWNGETLTLKGATIHCVQTDGIHSDIQREGNLNLVLAGENRISGSSSVTYEELFGVNASGDLTVSGEGKISIALGRTAYGTTYGLYQRYH